ncbi:MAG: zinc ribbon domain-containing protein [Caulobacterales bacterium]|nr:zinc ribbon domain-containing protein [Caulobacterales bacterium]
MNRPEAVTRVEVPHLRIVDQKLWDEVKAYQAALDRAMGLGYKRRPPRLFSNLLKCGCCGGGMSIVAQDRYGCSTARNKGICDNRTTVLERDIEHRVLEALSGRLMDAELCEVFCQEYTRHLNQLRMEHSATRLRQQQELERVEREIAKVIQSIKDGIDVTLIRDEANGLQRKKEELTRALETTQDAPVLVHPNMAHRYKVQIQNLMGALNDPGHRDEAGQILRQLIDRIVFTPTGDKSALAIDLIGDLAGILQLANQEAQGTTATKAKPGSDARKAELEQVRETIRAMAQTKLPPVSEGQVSVGAGAGFEPATFRL